MARSMFYVNVHILDGHKVFKEAVVHELKKSNLPFKGMAAVGAAAALKRFATPKRVAKRVSAKILKKVPLKMKENGVTATVEKVFRKGGYIVFKLHITHIDAVLATEMQLMKNGFETGSILPSLLQWLIWIVGSRTKHRIEHQMIPRMVQPAIRTQVAKALNERLTARKIEFESEVLKEEKQARYFFDKLKEMLHDGDDSSSSDESASSDTSDDDSTSYDESHKDD